MSFYDCASGNSLCYGIDYYKSKKVTSFKQVDRYNYQGFVCGNKDNVYDVSINLKKPKTSRCNCAFASDRHVICKHMIALYFTVFPDAYDEYQSEVEEYKTVEKRKRKEHKEDIRKYVYSLSKQELQDRLLEFLIQEDDERYYW